MHSGVGFRNYCLNQEFTSRSNGNKSYSKRAFARDLKLSSGELSEYLSGNRAMSFSKALKTVDFLGLNISEKREFILCDVDLELLSPSRQEEIKRLVLDKVPDFSFIKNSQLEQIHQWYYFVILEITNIPSIAFDASSISNYLGIAESEIDYAIKTLLKLGLLKKEPCGKVKKSRAYLKTRNRSVSSQVLRDRQKKSFRNFDRPLESNPYR